MFELPSTECDGVCQRTAAPNPVNKASCVAVEAHHHNFGGLVSVGNQHDVTAVVYDVSAEVITAARLNRGGRLINDRMSNKWKADCSMFFDECVFQ